jgi:hypothetical protein
VGLLVTICMASTLPAADERVREYVDEVTAVTITAPVDALIFARERMDLAANARDYITLTALEVNRAGKRSYFWFAYVWSTVDRRHTKQVLAPEDHLVLLADGRPIPLRAPANALRDLGVAQPPTRAPARTAVPMLFPAQPDEIAYVAYARELRIEVVRATDNEPFLVWKDARDSLRELTERLNLDP